MLPKSLQDFVRRVTTWPSMSQSGIFSALRSYDANDWRQVLPTVARSDGFPKCLTLHDDEQVRVSLHLWDARRHVPYHNHYPYALAGFRVLAGGPLVEHQDRLQDWPITSQIMFAGDVSMLRGHWYHRVCSVSDRPTATLNVRYRTAGVAGAAHEPVTVAPRSVPALMETGS